MVTEKRTRRSEPSVLHEASDLLRVDKAMTATSERRLGLQWQSSKDGGLQRNMALQ